MKIQTIRADELIRVLLKVPPDSEIYMSSRKGGIRKPIVSLGREIEKLYVLLPSNIDDAKVLHTVDRIG